VIQLLPLGPPEGVIPNFFGKWQVEKALGNGALGFSLSAHPKS